MKRVAAGIFQLLLITISFTAVAQKITLKESETVLKDYLHEAFVLNPDKYLVVNFAAPHSAFSLNRKENKVEVAAYDKNLNQVYSSIIEETKGSSYQAGMVINHQLYLFMSSAKQVTRYKLNDADGTATKLEDVFEVRNPKEYNFQKGYSRDSAYSFMICGNTITKDESTMDGVVMDKEGKIVTRFSSTVPVDRPNFDYFMSLVSNEGLVYMIMGTKVKKPEGFRPRRYTIIQVDKAGKSTSTDLTDIPEGSIADFLWQTSNDPLSFVATLAKDDKSGVTGIVKGVVDLQQKRMTFLKTMAFDQSAALIKTSDATAKALVKEGMPITAKIKAYYEMQDNEALIVFEPAGTRSYSRQSNTSSMIYNYTDSWSFSIYVARFSEDLQLQWLRRISKSQLEPTNPTYTGSVTLKDKKGGIHFLFHDDPDYTEVDGEVKRVALQGKLKNTGLADVYITKDGKASKKFLTNNEEQDRFLSPHGAVLFGNMLIYNSFRYKTMGASSYSIGKIIAE